MARERPSALAPSGVQVAPPPVVHESAGDHRPGHVWVPGYWDWRNGSHVWAGGRWVAARHGCHWRRHRWVLRMGGWSLVPGEWVMDEEAALPEGWEESRRGRE